ncbi:MAG: sirohydrochlorin chelatase [Mycobacterium sp.]|nr:sirohydrochlorin chelatase [Mycobacterium sp.]
MRLILTAHGSVDPRSVATSHAVADRIRDLRPRLDVRVAFCEKSTPNLREVLAELDGPAVVTPLLLASAYHARVDIPSIIAESGADVDQAETLGEDLRLVRVMHQRLAQLGVEQQCSKTGVLVVAVGSSHTAANVRTAAVAGMLARGTGWAGVQVAHATGSGPSVSDGIDRLRQVGARRIALAPWFIAPGRITDRVAASAQEAGVAMAEPLGASRLLAATVLDRFDLAVAQRLAA